MHFMVTRVRKEGKKLASTRTTTNSPPIVFLVNIDELINKVVICKISLGDLHSFSEDAR